MCPQCLTKLPEDAPQGLCPSCLMALATLATDQDTLPMVAADFPSLTEITQAFPDLEIVERIGQGGMGVVFKARQPRLDRTVALKVLPKRLAATLGFPERFKREGRVLARLNHPSIVAVHDFGESGGFCYLLMEYVDGVNLRQAMKAGRFTPEQALKVVPDICTALQYAHEQGVLHRDIKPENILLNAKGEAKIADFGIAKLLDETGGDMLLTQSGAKLGTAPYMAPEQIEQPSTVDHRADIYSLGVVLYELLTGELPLGRFAAPSEKSAVNGNVDAVVFRALEKERGRRQQSAGEFKTEIEGLASGHGMSTFRYSKLSEPFEYKSKRTFWGLPLLHVVQGPDPMTGKRRMAHGIFAFGEHAKGIFAFGGIARGWFAFGGVAVGGVALGGVSIGLISIGGMALALLLSIGGLSIGALATGGVAAGWHASGGVVIAWHGIGGVVAAHQAHGGIADGAQIVKEISAMPMLTQWLARLSPVTSSISLLWFPLFSTIFVVPWWARKQLAIESGELTGEAAAHPNRIFWIIPAMILPCVVFWWMLLVMTSPNTTQIGQCIVSVVVASVGLLLYLMAIPLWLRLVPMNPIYGVRLPSTLTSDQRWHAVNAYFGKQAFYWSLVLMVAGKVGLYQLPRHIDSYYWGACTLTLASIIVMTVSTLWWMRLNPDDQPKPKRSLLAYLSGQIIVAVLIAMFVRTFIVGAYRIPQGNEPGVAKNSQWLASRLNTGFAPGDLIAYDHENGHAWIARVVAQEPKGLRLKRGGSPDEFFIPWDKVIGKMWFSYLSSGELPKP
ncbi:MAG: protein kinase [Verrucomicrobia bacterium]|nr:protein kinase [Verrucomicrobiota bacterium]